MTQISIHPDHFILNGTCENHPKFGDSIKVFSCNSNVMRVHAIIDEENKIDELRFYCSGYEIFPNEEIKESTMIRVLEILNS